MAAATATLARRDLRLPGRARPRRRSRCPRLRRYAAPSPHRPTGLPARPCCRLSDPSPTSSGRAACPPAFRRVPPCRARRGRDKSGARASCPSAATVPNTAHGYSPISFGLAFDPCRRRIVVAERLQPERAASPEPAPGRPGHRAGAPGSSAAARRRGWPAGAFSRLPASVAWYIFPPFPLARIRSVRPISLGDPDLRGLEIDALDLHDDVEDRLPLLLQVQCALALFSSQRQSFLPPCAGYGQSICGRPERQGMLSASRTSASRPATACLAVIVGALRSCVLMPSPLHGKCSRSKAAAAPATTAVTACKPYLAGYRLRAARTSCKFRKPPHHVSALSRRARQRRPAGASSITVRSRTPCIARSQAAAPPLASRQPPWPQPPEPAPSLARRSRHQRPRQLGDESKEAAAPIAGAPCVQRRQYGDAGRGSCRPPRRVHCR